jgi:enoyl-CoA hydratase/carnithine racemase
LDAAVGDIVDDLAAGGPKALAVSKQLVYKVPAMDRPDAFAWTGKLSAELFQSDEAAEGIKSFREKSSPSWVP